MISHVNKDKTLRIKPQRTQITVLGKKFYRNSDYLYLRELNYVTLPNRKSHKKKEKKSL